MATLQNGPSRLERATLQLQWMDVRSLKGWPEVVQVSRRPRPSELRKADELEPTLLKTRKREEARAARGADTLRMLIPPHGRGFKARQMKHGHHHFNTHSGLPPYPTPGALGFHLHVQP